MPHKPPVTPSPHRFLAGNPRSLSPSKDVRPGSSLRKEIPQSKTRSVPQPPTSSQFATTPRFSFGKSKTATQDQRSPSPPKPAVVQSFRASTRPSDDVEDAGDLNDDDEMLDSEHVTAVPTTEQYAEDDSAEQQWTNDIAFSPKRRRLDDDATLVSPARPTFKHPSVPASALHKTTPPFVHTQQQPTQTSRCPDAAPSHRPAFLRPSAEPHEQNEPLPETFSPHKRGQKFEPGGMAATVQQWVIETGHAAVQSRKGQGYLKGEDYVTRVKVENFAGDGPFTVRARLANSERVDVLLAGHRLPNSAQTQEVSEGCVVGIRAPTWEMELDGTVWTVGVDWRVLS